MKICLVIPCFKSREQIVSVLTCVPEIVQWIVLVDDGCPQNTGVYACERAGDPRLILVKHPENRGVGAAVVTGFAKAIELDSDIIVRIDSDGQMDPALIPEFINPLVQGVADFSKGNRFWEPETVLGMPWVRIVGNGVLSLFAKLSTGYWGLMDPNNGFFAIHTSVLNCLRLNKLEQRYFFESDLLFRLNTIRAVGVDIPMASVYGDEKSNLSPLRSVPEFFVKHTRNTVKRIVYSYFIRDFNAASLQLILGTLFLLFGAVFGVTQWVSLSHAGALASSGTVMLAALPVLLGFQLLLAALQYDISCEPRIPLHTIFSPSMANGRKDS